MQQSEHDLIAEKIRREETEKLIEHYMLQAIDASADYGFLNVRGHEVPDPTVVEPPLGYVAQPDLMTMMRNMIRTSLSQIAQDSEFETFEEADDFDIDDDPVEASPYEMYFDPAPGAEAGPPGEIRPDPNNSTPPLEPPQPPADGRGGGGAEPPSA